MSKFLVLYLSSVSAEEQMATGTPEQMVASRDASMAWMASAGSAVVDFGSPIRYALTVPSDASPRGGLHAGGYSFMEADSVDSLRALLGSHPHLQAPDAAIEVHELLPMPGM